ncbi:MAG: hypothetical protein P0S96_08600 [Simkaniaceae bacterium]|nr:hypothetical protein [Candidatus Sacchlamyda saccharinae]
MEQIKKYYEKVLRFLEKWSGPKYFFSINGEKFCLVSKKNNQLTIESFGEDVKPLSRLEEKEAELVTGLDSEDVILRQLKLKLKSKREILATLPFQVENLLPYSQEELILLPTLEVQKDITLVSLLATSESSVTKHLIWDADIVSCAPLALFRYARHYFPEKESLFLRHENTLIVIENRELRAFQTIRHGDSERVLAHLQSKYPKIDPNPVTEGKNFGYAVAIGLALDAASQDPRSGQFRQGAQLSQRHLERKKKNFVQFFAACACFVLLTWSTGHLHLKKRENSALQALGYAKKTKLTSVIQELETSLYKQSKSKTTVSPLPKISELLAWMSAHPKLADCSIQRLRYELVRAPRLGTQIKTYSAKVELELTTQNPAAARKFHEMLVRERKIIDQKQEVRWNADHGIYRATFHVKPQSL